MRARAIITVVPVLWCLATPSLAAGPAVAAVESTVSLAAGPEYTFNHAAYHAVGDDVSGLTPALTLRAALLRPASTGADYYAALTDSFSTGHTAEARLGAGLPLTGGAEIIPYFAVGYQGWNNVLAPSGAGAVFYSGPLAGAGTKLDLPLSSRLVVSLGAAFLALAGGSISGGTLSSTSTGVTPEAHVELGLDGAAYGPVHLFAQAWATHFAVAGSALPFSTTTQTGVNLGVGYSF